MDFAVLLFAVILTPMYDCIGKVENKKELEELYYKPPEPPEEPKPIGKLHVRCPGVSMGVGCGTRCHHVHCTLTYTYTVVFLVGLA